MTPSDRDRVDRMIAFHQGRAENLTRYANRWWRVSRYAWLAAADVHLYAVEELTVVRSWLR